MDFVLFKNSRQNIYIVLLPFTAETVKAVRAFLPSDSAFIRAVYKWTHAVQWGERRGICLLQRKRGGGWEGARSCTQLKQHPTEIFSTLRSLPVFSSPSCGLRIEKPNHSHYAPRPSASTELPVTVRLCACAVNSSLESANELF